MSYPRNDGDPLGSVLLLPGDGIGPEVFREVRRVMDWFARARGRIVRARRRSGRRRRF